jgi:hypothetical protein
MARRRIVRIVTLAAVVLVLTLAVGGAVLLWFGGEILAGYFAKTLCSCVFVARRDAASCLEEDLGAQQSFVRTEVDAAAKRVTAIAFLFRHASAVYRPGLGCALQ